jgi:ESX secretion-associated protein EspG
MTVSHLEFDLLWEHVGFTERPYPLTVASFGETMAERAELRTRVRESLRAKGLHDGSEVDPRLEETLLLVAGGTLCIDGQLSVGRHLRVLAAGTRGRAVLVTQTDDTVSLTPLREHAMVPSIVGLLPDEQPGPGGTVRLAKAVFDEVVEEFGTGGHLGMERALNRGGVAGRDMRTVLTLLESGRHGGGQLAVTSADQLGRRTRTPVLNWFDTEPGRYLVLTEPSRDGVEWLTIVPADTDRIARRLTELVDRAGTR